MNKRNRNIIIAMVVIAVIAVCYVFFVKYNNNTIQNAPDAVVGPSESSPASN